MHRSGIPKKFIRSFDFIRVLFLYINPMPQYLHTCSQPLHTHIDYNVSKHELLHKAGRGGKLASWPPNDRRGCQCFTACCTALRGKYRLDQPSLSVSKPEARSQAINQSIN